MKIISKNFINRFGKNNQYPPSLLPKYKGLNTYSRIIKNKEKRLVVVLVNENWITEL